MKSIIKKITLMSLSPLLAAGVIFGILSISTGCSDSNEDKNQDKEYATWMATGIKFYQGAGVSDAEMDDMIDEFDNNYSTWIPSLQNKFKSNVLEIHVTKDGTIVSGNTTDKILYVGKDAVMGDGSDGGILDYIGNHGFFAKITQKNNIMLAKYNNLKKQVAVQMKKIEAERQA